MKSIKKYLVLSGLLLTALSSKAQVTTSYSLTLEGAKVVAMAAHQYAIDNKAPGGSIAVVDNGGHLIYLERLDNSFPASSGVAIEKARAAAAFQFPTKKLEDAITGGRTSLITVGYTMLQGGIPIVQDGHVLGAIGVSGAASAQQDEEIAIAGSKATIQL